MDVSNKVVFVIVASVLQLAISNVAAVDHLVGDEKGWSTNIDYRSWAKDKIFRVGDTLVFKYPTGANNVVQVKRDAFKNCMAPPTSQARTSGNDVVELTTPGRKWYISGIGDHCSEGKQKLVIDVFPVSVHPPLMDMAPTPVYPVLPLPLIPGLPFQTGYRLPPSLAPCPPSSSKSPPLWWKFMFPPSVAPAPSTEFPWKFMFPPSEAPAPSIEFPWKFMFPPSEAPAASIESPFQAPIPSLHFPWKFIFPPSQAPIPSLHFPWKFLIPPVHYSSSSPSHQLPLEVDVSSDD
ncbi:hypothetical protein LIER_34485 [Lithospermum erythrorhizon]|uniref:Phytocyanin domain-containing protein n=1 Tax=Lithospermum erythrorhizon TaxID=34254 RepID=A0AAV3S393_LITER